MMLKEKLLTVSFVPIFLFVLFLAAPFTMDAAVFNIASGDVNGLVAAMDQANINGENDVINLAAGTYTLAEAHDSDENNGDVGLPIIEFGTKLTINGPSLDQLGAQTVIIRRDDRAAPFRILFNKGNLRLDRVQIENGFSNDKDGGGIFNQFGATLNISNSLITKNRTNLDYAGQMRGGGILDAGRLILLNSTVSHNQAYSGGGIFTFRRANLIRSTISNNYAESSGGGILTVGVLKAVNSTIADNTAFKHSGGGLHVSGGAKVKLKHVTIGFNIAGDDGGGIYNEPVNEGTIKMQTTIVGNNWGQGSSFSECTGTMQSEGYNYLTENSGCNFIETTGDIVLPDGTTGFGLDDLKDNNEGNGAPLTIDLLDGSLAIDAVPVDKCGALVDQRNFVRPEVVLSSRTPCDIGATEKAAKPACPGFFAPIPATIVGTKYSTVINGTDGPDVIHGLGGNDTINGLQGDDIICGGTGTDTINGDGDKDTLYGEDGNDTVNGGSGSDIISDILGSLLEVGNNILNGEGGNDSIYGGRGDDTIDGGDGNNDKCNGYTEINADTQINCEDYSNFP